MIRITVSTVFSQLTRGEPSFFSAYNIFFIVKKNKKEYWDDRKTKTNI